MAFPLPSLPLLFLDFYFGVSFLILLLVRWCDHHHNSFLTYLARAQGGGTRSSLRVRGIVVSISVPIFLLNFMLLIYVICSSLSPFTFPRLFLIRSVHDRQARSRQALGRQRPHRPPPQPSGTQPSTPPSQRQACAQRVCSRRQ